MLVKINATVVLNHLSRLFAGQDRHLRKPEKFTAGGWLARHIEWKEAAGKLYRLESSIFSLRWQQSQKPHSDPT